MSALRVLMMLAVTTTKGEVLDRETYDDLPWDMELMYPVYMELGSELGGGATPPRQLAETWPSRGVSKMLTALRNRDTSSSLLSIPKWIPSETVLMPPEALDAPLRRIMLKRDESAKSGAPKTGATPQLKWNKKGKGASVLCYFKICSFHPSYA